MFWARYLTIHLHYPSIRNHGILPGHIPCHSPMLKYWKFLGNKNPIRTRTKTHLKDLGCLLLGRAYY